MLPAIGKETITEVAELVQAWHTSGWGRKAATAPLLQQLDRRGRWLLSFLSYLLSGNRLWRSVDEDLYTQLPPAPTQEADFTDLIELLRHYRSATITAGNERELIRFLTRCTPANQELFLAVLSRQKWLREMFMAPEIRERIDAHAINPEGLYGGTTLLTEGWFAVSYPLVITTLPALKLTPASIAKRGSSITITKYTIINRNNGTRTRETVPTEWLAVDRKFLLADTFILYGMLAEEQGEFYPLDLFSSKAEYRRHRQQPLTGFRERQQNLDAFLATSFLRQIKKVERVYCYGPAEVGAGIGRALRNAPHAAAVILCDEKGRTHAVPAAPREGVIEGLWEESGHTLGLEIWSNTRKIRCAFDFSGGNHELLYNLSLLRRKHVRFHHCRVKGFEGGAVTEILWNKQPYYPKRVLFRDGTRGFLERCPICLRDDVHHKYYGGVCSSTYNNWRSMMASRGTDRWFDLSPKIRGRRDRLGWEPTMVNNVRITFRGHRVVANEAGQIMFQSDPEAMQHYEQTKQNPHRRYHNVCSTANPEELQAWYRTNYNIKGTNHESGAVREVSGLHDEPPLETAGEG